MKPGVFELPPPEALIHSLRAIWLPEVLIFLEIFRLENENVQALDRLGEGGEPTQDLHDILILWLLK